MSLYTLPAHDTVRHLLDKTGVLKSVKVPNSSVSLSRNRKTNRLAVHPSEPGPELDQQQRQLSEKGQHCFFQQQNRCSLSTANKLSPLSANMYLKYICRRHTTMQSCSHGATSCWIPHWRSSSHSGPSLKGAGGYLHTNKPTFHYQRKIQHTFIHIIINSLYV